MALPETPVTRTEQYLDAIARGVGGGGSSLPAVTSDDNGDVLTVVNGAWDKAAPGGGGGYTIQAEISYDDTTHEYTVSTEATFADIKSAVESGKPCFLFGERPEELFCAYLGSYRFAEGSEYAYFSSPMAGYEDLGKVYLTYYELRCDTSGWSFTYFMEAVT